MPNPRPGGLPTVTLVLLLLAAGCTPSGHPPGTRGQAPYQESSAAAAEYLAAAEPANRRQNEAVCFAAQQGLTGKTKAASLKWGAQRKAIERNCPAR